MKVAICSFCLIILIYSISFCQDNSEETPGGNSELGLYNYTNRDLEVTLFPVSILFNGQNKQTFVSNKRTIPFEQSSYNTNYINGTWVIWDQNLNQYVRQTKCTTGTAPYLTSSWNDDFGEGSLTALSNVGFGRYKILIKQLSYPYTIDSAIIDMDYYVGNERGDIYLYLYDESNIPSGRYRFCYHMCCDYVNNFVELIYDQNDPSKYTIRNWRPNGDDPLYAREKILGPVGGFEYTDDFPNNLSSVFPKDPRLHCAIIDPSNNFIVDQNHIYPEDMDIFVNNAVEERHGTLTLDLKIKTNVQTPQYFYRRQGYDYNPANIVPAINIIENGRLTVCTSPTSLSTFEMKQYLDQYNNPMNKGAIINVESDSYLILENAYSNNYNNRVELIMNPYCLTTIKQGGWLMHGNQSVIHVKDNSRLTLKNGSYYCSGSNKNSLILVYPYGVFCNEGATIGGRLIVRYLGGNHYLQCDIAGTDIYINDSTQYTLSDSTTLIIPDNKIVHFQGNETLLQLDSNSTVKFGQNSKIVFENGARISARYSKFTSLTTNATYSGIVLSGISRDTIQNCVIENAVDGITIKDKQNIVGTAATTEISNCSFVNSTTSSQLSNAVYVLNSGDVLLKNNTVSSTSQSNGFSIGFWFEYCSPVNVSLLNNTVNNCLDGIYMVQSSPFVYGNTVTGQSGSVCGLYLDNCNSTIKNNTITNFSSSLIGNFSSPYLYGNTFSGASVANLDLRKSMVPVMGPVASGSSIYWYGGRNLLSGSPSSSYIKITDDAYPSMDGGYNTITGSSYFIQGDLPVWLPSNNLNATYNYWDNANFDGSRFDVSNSGTVSYDPLFDGSSYPSYDTYTLIPHGFDVYDTVFIQGSGDSPVSSMFTQAVDKEYQLRYTDAIGLYKQVIAEFKQSEYAVMSVSRIFDCLQKMGGDLSRYTTNNTYLAGIKNNSEYSTLMRELAEDFIIKGQARAGLVSNAISDYESIYQQNQNNYKGLHAIINKACLEAFVLDTLGDYNGMNTFSLSNHKNSILNALKLRTREQLSGTANNIVPTKYILEQNYPNPFNPVTKIAYSIPKESRVTLVVYDILGREITKLVNNETKKAGTYILEFNAFNFASGVYFYRIQANDFVQTKRMVLVK